jgi:hypothetical protein
MRHSTIIKPLKKKSTEMENLSKINNSNPMANGLTADYSFLP